MTPTRRTFRLTAICLAIVLVAVGPTAAVQLPQPRASSHHLAPRQGTNASATTRIVSAVNVYPSIFANEALGGIGIEANTAAKGIVFSGFNIHHAISLLIAASRTPETFLSALFSGNLANAPALAYPDYIAGVSQILRSVLGTTGANISIASSVWLRNTITLTPAYNDTVTNQLLGTTASVPQLDATVINSWVGNATRGKITQIVDGSISRYDAVLASAIYFRDTWQVPFSVNTALVGPFTTLATTTTPAVTTSLEYMFLESSLAYVYTDSYTAVRVPFAHGFDAYYVRPSTPPAAGGTSDPRTYVASAFAFTPFTTSPVPSTGKAGTDLPKASTPTSLRLRLEVPRNVKLDSGPFDLVSMWSNATNAADGPNYAALTKPFPFLNETAPFQVTLALHKATIVINENGTEASAATVIGVDVAAMVDPPVLVKFNSPFFFHIVHRETSAVVFTALYTGPTNATPATSSSTASATPGSKSGAGRVLSGRGHWEIAMGLAIAGLLAVLAAL